MLELKGCLVTLDAMGCQRKIAQTILNKKADYLLAVKGNQGKGHARLETRFCIASDDLSPLGDLAVDISR